MIIEPFTLVTNSAARVDKDKELRNARDYVETQFKFADDIVIISGFYGEEFIKQTMHNIRFRGRGRRLVFVFASLPDVARQQQIESLLKLKGHIINTYRSASNNIDIRLIVDSRFLHAKLFRFRRKDRIPVYITGSANFSEAAFTQNDEALVVIKGRHVGLNRYIKHILERSRSISDLPSNVSARSWRDFLRNGYLYYRPSRAIAYNIDPFADDEFKLIADRLRLESFNPLPFSERNVLSLNVADLLGLDPPENVKLGFRLPTYAIETDYGYWVPKIYVDFIQARLEDAFGPKRRALERRGEELQMAESGYVDAQIKIYLDEVQRRINTGPKPVIITESQMASIKDKIVRRVSHLRKLLAHPEAINRLAQLLVGAPVPEFWEDRSSVDRFFYGFCYDIVSKLNEPKNTPKIVTHLSREFGIRDDDGVEECQERIERFFHKGNAWPEDNWPSVPDLEG